MRRALILGRFQPPHAGHLYAIRQTAQAYDQVVVLVGSAQESYTPANPFTAGERIEMLEAALEDAGVGNTRIYPIQDIHRHAQWVAYVDSQVPEYDVVVTNNPLTRTLFGQAGYEIEELEMHRRNECSGTRIRARLAEGKDVGDRVPQAVARLLDRVDAADRIQALAEDDEDA